MTIIIYLKFAQIVGIRQNYERHNENYPKQLKMKDNKLISALMTPNRIALPGTYFILYNIFQK